MILYYTLTKVNNDAPNGNPLEADAFGQLLSTFRIVSKFDKELCIVAVAQRRKEPRLCRFIGSCRVGALLIN